MEADDANIEREGDQSQREAQERRDWVKETKAKKHVQGTDSAYTGKVLSFVTFAGKNFPDVLRQAFKDGFNKVSGGKDETKKRRKFVVEYMARVQKGREETALLNTELVTEDVVLQWLSEFKGKKGSTPSKSVYGTAQSALGNLFRQHGVTMPDDIMSGVGEVKKGAQRARAQEKVEGLVPIEEGKAAIPGHLYLELVEALLKSGTDVFCHTFAVCAWVLMCRVSNVAELRGAHFKWENDSIVISLVKHKADQGGERTDPKHCYANPFKPYACVVTSLGIYFAIYGPPKSVRDLVFEGNRQHDRFVEAVRRVLESNVRMKQEMERLGIKVEIRSERADAPTRRAEPRAARRLLRSSCAACGRWREWTRSTCATRPPPTSLSAASWPCSTFPAPTLRACARISMPWMMLCWPPRGSAFRERPSSWRASCSTVSRAWCTIAIICAPICPERTRSFARRPLRRASWNPWPAA
jgi:hypothetical protein